MTFRDLKLLLQFTIKLNQASLHYKECIINVFIKYFVYYDLHLSFFIALHFKVIIPKSIPPI